MSLLDELLSKRRSIRKYKADIPPAEWIEKMIQCAAKAPSPSNSQPVRFIRIDSDKPRDSLSRAMADGHQKLLCAWEKSRGPKRLRNRINAYRRFSEFMFNAPVFFAVGTIVDFDGFSKKLFEAKLIEQDSRGEIDMDITTGLALKGFILKGEEFGLGSCILTAPLVFIPNAEEILGIKEIRIKCFITTGFPDEIPPPIDKKKTAEIYRKI